MIWAVTAWLGLAGLYLLLAGDVSAVEITADIVCATAGAALAVGLARIARRRFAGWPASRAVWRPLAALLPETLAAGWQFLSAIFISKDERGAYVHQPFEPGGDDPVSAGRRAAAVLGVSLAPSSFVICGDRTGPMILHALPRKAASPDPLWPA